MQNIGSVAKTGDSSPVEQMRVDPGNLRCDVCTNTHGPTRKLINQLESLQIEIMTATGQQGLDVLDHRRHDQLIAVGAIEIEQAPAQHFDATRLAGQNVGNAFGQQPARHEPDLGDETA